MRNTMSSSYHSKVISTESKGVTFLFCLVHGLLVIFSHVFSFYFLKVSIVNSDLINFVDVQRLHENIKWIVFLTRLSYNLFTKALLLFRISLLKRFTYRRVSTPKILRGAMIPIMVTKEQVKTISDHFINKKLPSSQVIYYLLTRKIVLIQNILHTCWKNVLTCSICHRVDLWNIWLLLYGNISSELSYINDYFQIPTFLIDEHCSR